MQHIKPLAKTTSLRWRFTYDIESRQFLCIRDDSTVPFQHAFNFTFPLITCYIHAPNKHEAENKGFLRVILYLTQKGDNDNV